MSKGEILIQLQTEPSEYCCSHDCKSIKKTLRTNTPTESTRTREQVTSSPFDSFPSLDDNSRTSGAPLDIKYDFLKSRNTHEKTKYSEHQQIHDKDLSLTPFNHSFSEKPSCSGPSSLAKSWLQDHIHQPIPSLPHKPNKNKAYTPPSRHIIPKLHSSSNHRAKTYTDLLPFEINQLTKILSYHPDPHIPPSSPSWTNYADLTTPLIAALPLSLHARLVFPGFRPSDLCHLHRKLNPKPLRHILCAIQHEIIVRKPKVWNRIINNSNKEEMLSREQLRVLRLVDRVAGLWLSSEEYFCRYGALPDREWTCQEDGCVACTLSRMGGKIEVATALGALMLGAMKKGGMKSNRVTWCKEWVRNAVVGSSEDEEREMGKMDGLGDGLRVVRKRWREEERGGKRGKGIAGLEDEPSKSVDAVVEGEETDLEDGEQIWGLSCASEAHLNEDSDDSILDDAMFKDFAFDGNTTDTKTTTTTIMVAVPEPPSPSVYSNDSGYTSCVSPFSSRFK